MALRMTSSRPRKYLSNWLSKGPPDLKESALVLLDCFQPLLEAIGFAWVTRDMRTGVSVRSGAATFQRRNGDVVETVEVIFDKYWRRSFKIMFVSHKLDGSNQILLRSGKLARKQSELEGYAWWGCNPFLEIFGARKLRREVALVCRLLPQVVDYLDRGVEGPNIFAREVRLRDPK